jgi:hypothetical protein
MGTWKNTDESYLLGETYTDIWRDCAELFYA